MGWPVPQFPDVSTVVWVVANLAVSRSFLSTTLWSFV